MLGTRTESNSHKKNCTIELNRTFDFRTLDFCETADVENQYSSNKLLETPVSPVYPGVKHLFFVNAEISAEKWLQMRCGLLALNALYKATRIAALT